MIRSCSRLKKKSESKVSKLMWLYHKTDKKNKKWNLGKLSSVLLEYLKKWHLCCFKRKGLMGMPCMLGSCSAQSIVLADSSNNFNELNFFSLQDHITDLKADVSIDDTKEDELDWIRKLKHQVQTRTQKSFSSHKQSKADHYNWFQTGNFYFTS